MMQDAPSLYLNKLVQMLTSTRALGHAERTRAGSDLYSMELDFRTNNEVVAQAVAVWARAQAPYAQIQVVPASAAGGLLTIFAGVDLQRLALYLVEHVLVKETGRTFDTAKGALPAAVKLAITNFDKSSSWLDLRDDLRRGAYALESYLSIFRDQFPNVSWDQVLYESLTRSVPAKARDAFIDDLEKQVMLLRKMVQALETGDWLKPLAPRR